jgi:hypothetical protein
LLTPVEIQNIQNDTGKLSTSVAKERETSEKLLKELATSITGFEQTPMAITSKTDPYVYSPLSDMSFTIPVF